MRTHRREFPVQPVFLVLLGKMNTVPENFHYNITSMFLYCLDVSQSRHVRQFQCGEFSFPAVCNRPFVKVF
jgi:hypothetical protein